ncbi:MAG: hypothetical protein H6747_11940 [Deltaproteobacteria bacterium]|nr:hypothetical protein [Deltaproteobacteria bacterium]
MRLPSVERGERISHRVLYAMIRLVSGRRAPDVIRTMKYHGAFFGDHMYVHDVLRGPSPWSVGERELFAAWVSKQNHCEF